MGKPKGAGSVMADHAPAEVEADDPRTALFRKLNYFPTPPWATRAGAEALRALDPTAVVLREPACGEGHMAGPLAETFTVYPSDVHRYGDNAAGHEAVAARRCSPPPARLPRHARPL